MELFFLCTALSLHVLDQCMKLYWKRKTQRTAGPTARPPDRPPGDSYIPPQTSFRGYNNNHSTITTTISRYKIFSNSYSIVVCSKSTTTLLFHSFIQLFRTQSGFFLFNFDPMTVVDSSMLLLANWETVKPAYLQYPRCWPCYPLMQPVVSQSCSSIDCPVTDHLDVLLSHLLHN